MARFLLELLHSFADALEYWVSIEDLKGFNVGVVTSFGSLVDLVDPLVSASSLRGREPGQVDAYFGRDWT